MFEQSGKNCILATNFGLIPQRLLHSHTWHSWLLGRGFSYVHKSCPFNTACYFQEQLKKEGKKEHGKSERTIGNDERRYYNTTNYDK